MIKRTVTLMVAVAAIYTAPAAMAAASPRVSISADVRCLPLGGIGIDLTVANTGSRVARISPDIHLLIEPVRVGGRAPGIVLFVFPAPGWDRIPPDDSRTFLLTAGEPFEGEPALDLSGHRILIETEVWLRGRDRPVVKTMAVPACAVS